MPAGIIGNSRMLACLRDSGEIYRLFWPDIDYAQHLGTFWTGLNIRPPRRENRTKWFHTKNWAAGQRYIEDTNSIETTCSNKQLNLKVVQVDFVLPDRDVLVRRYHVTNLGQKTRNLYFFVYCAPFMEESKLYDGVFFDYANQALVYFRRRVCLTLAASSQTLAGFQCGRRGTSSDPLIEAARGNLWGIQDNMLMSSGSLAWDMGGIEPGSSGEITLYLIAGRSEESNRDHLAALTAKEAGEWQAYSEKHWQGLLQKVRTLPAGERESAVYKRSILAMHLMTNKETGATIAAPEFDPQYLACGGYGYCWGRDATFAAVALDEAGYEMEARKFYKFAAGVQLQDGSWQQRYFTDGSAAPSWGKQIDQAGIILWGYWHHYRTTQNKGFLAEIWPSTVAGADYLAGCLEENGLPAAGMDLWEDEFSQNTYSSAATFGGLKAAAHLAAETGEKEKAEFWSAAAERVRAGIKEHLWSADKNRFVRGINRRVSEDAYRQSLQNGEKAFSGTDRIGLYKNYWVARDTRLDAALLGLAFPFAVLRPDDPRMILTARAIEEELWNSTAGGVHRYAGDGYRGGNPWLITTFWLSIYHSMLGNKKRARELCLWCLKQVNHLLLMPEQADGSAGGPSWVMPLSWSHAMYILAALALEGKLSFPASDVPTKG